MHKKQESESANKKKLTESLSRIEQSFETLSNKQQDFVNECIDGVINAMGTGNLAELVYSIRGSTRKNLEFDNEIAVKIRKEAGYKTRTAFARKLGFERPGYIMLGLYEKGKRKPSNPPRGETPKRYMYSLKDLGYDPYKLPPR